MKCYSLKVKNSKKAKLHTGALEHFRIIKVTEGDYLFIEMETNFTMTKHHSSLFFIYLRKKASISSCVLSTHLKQSFFRPKYIHFTNNSHQIHKNSPLGSRPADGQQDAAWLSTGLTAAGFFLPNGKHTLLSHPWQKLCIVSKNVTTFTKYFAYKDIFTQKHHCTWYRQYRAECKWQTSFWISILMVPPLKEHFLHVFLKSVWAWRSYNHNHRK